MRIRSPYAPWFHHPGNSVARSTSQCESVTPKPISAFETDPADRRFDLARVPQTRHPSQVLARFCWRSPASSFPRSQSCEPREHPKNRDFQAFRHLPANLALRCSFFCAVDRFFAQNTDPQPVLHITRQRPCQSTAITPNNPSSSCSASGLLPACSPEAKSAASET